MHVLPTLGYLDPEGFANAEVPIPLALTAGQLWQVPCGTEGLGLGGHGVCGA